uniref:Tyrosine specific protein phosphatases domain-containing protein n=1 Tax=Neobodo designis TaxID=312471 RepID=A0A7S1W4W3_NEODS|mmetsp:Transcript_52858/g.162740  ORF Transcript_52858/g.162740 Transcript_52858/m.162740 type:complete len:358 (+) Transcript_52858:39-1112(+)|eukprot:CAMPEP_0174839158 /NCGR_PEP_ID=MMETSP1114-20130205/7865_1 /TAXON_ID=312471 /ORGANISM="Neobodo designis, Strain CCAP 1951/1" /LENGTH=357 /DNA_ID=CAMNT_0016073279 /DNA_START=38 /DNA_END=1111 /DNA_ORIENTATION=-
MSNLAGLKRVDEHKLQELQDRAARGDPDMTEMDLLWLSVLQDRYALFLEEGLRLLKKSQPQRAPAPNSPPATPNSPPGSASPSSSPAPESGAAARIGSLFGRLRGASSVFSGASPVNNNSLSSSGSFAGGGPQQQETAKLCRHWSWVADYLVLGAVPLAEAGTDPSAHLIGLKEQCKERSKTVSVVVSALEFDEAAEEAMRPFAGPREWEEIMGTDAFVHIGLPKDLDAEVTTPIADMVAVCAQVHDAIVSHGRCVFMHCKAGLARCWVLAMCYLTAHRNMTVDEADGLLSVVRPQLKPTEQHRVFVGRFVEHIMAQRAPPRSKEEDEATYYRVLAELLSLPPQYRQRIVRDIEQLT